MTMMMTTTTTSACVDLVIRMGTHIVVAKGQCGLSWLQRHCRPTSDKHERVCDYISANGVVYFDYYCIGYRIDIGE